MHLTVIRHTTYGNLTTYKIPNCKPLKKRDADGKHRREHYERFAEHISEDRVISVEMIAPVAEWLMDAECGDMLKIDGDGGKRITVTLLATDRDPAVKVLKEVRQYVTEAYDNEADEAYEEEDSEDEESDDDEEDEPSPKPRYRGATKC